MAPLTPAQKAVLERIERKKELMQKKAAKRKAKTDTVTVTSANQVNDIDSNSKRRRIETEDNNNNPPEVSTSRKDARKGDATTSSKGVEQGAGETAQTATRRGRKTGKPDETLNSTVVEASTSVPPKATVRRGRKTEADQEPGKAVADTFMNEAQLRVLQMLEEKGAAKDKGRKSLKPPKAVIPPKEDVVEIESDPTSEAPGAKSKARSKVPVKIVPVEISEEEEEPPPSIPERRSLVDQPVEEDEDPGPLNATMIAVMEQIKEKKARASIKRTPARPRATPKKPEPAPCAAQESAGPLTPNQVSVLNKLREKGTAEKSAITVELSDDNDEDDAQRIRVTDEEIDEVVKRLSKPQNGQERNFGKRLRDEGVFDATEQGRALDDKQTALVLHYKNLLNITVPPRGGSPLKRAARRRNVSDDDESETEVTDEIVDITTKKNKGAGAVATEEGSDMECAESTPPKTCIIFDTNAYLRILPYCRALLASDKLKGTPDYEELIMFALFVVIRELDSLSKWKAHLKQSAMAAIRLVHGALQDKNRHIEGQDFASSTKQLADSRINDDYILNSAELVRARGDNVIVVTDDKNLQVKMTMMRISTLNCLEFIAKYHWLSPIITSDVRREAVLIGDTVLAQFTEVVVASIVLKGVLAHLAPLPMERRREIFPSEKLATVLSLLLKNKSLLTTYTGPFSVLNYDRVAQTLTPLQQYEVTCRGDPQDEKKFVFFARFANSAEILCRNIASYFPNMETRAELVGDPEPPPKLRTPRQTKTTRKKVAEPEPEPPAEPIYFSFSQGRETRSTFKPVETAETSKPFTMSPRRPVAQRTATGLGRQEAPKTSTVTPSRAAAPRDPTAGPYAELHDSISDDVSAVVYEYFQKFGLSICNYTGSCCVKLGVRFSLAFKVSTARLESSLPQVTDSFDLVLKAMKKIIMGSKSPEPARDFILHSANVMDAIGKADPELVNSLPRISPESLLAFSRNSEGKQQLVTGYQQFCDFNNCLEKCWLEAQRT
ncbi:uncharacterized protein LOC100897368 [Galendromus occidentalis]|uniref:Uncharacterized protein LOC100897368 n=1 Tax=Galendromus occidentalis TaxID=34638 RepID=A0AAJ6QM23_9ACAR|nr:uncharacterized protein LOC100897368 [Galendromus occidentalis]